MEIIEKHACVWCGQEIDVRAAVCPYCEVAQRREPRSLNVWQRGLVVGALFGAGAVAWSYATSVEAPVAETDLMLPEPTVEPVSPVVAAQTPVERPLPPNRVLITAPTHAQWSFVLPELGTRCVVKETKEPWVLPQAFRSAEIRCFGIGHVRQDLLH